MTPRVSVVVVSHGRPQSLCRTLTGLSQLSYPNFEIVVVADSAGAKALSHLPFASALRTVLRDEAGISEARNIGISHAAGDIVAFIDDDAVPEPLWLAHLIAPFADPAVGAATGYVRGRNGISFQSRGSRVNACGWETPIPTKGDAALVLQTAPGDAVKTVGTNFAVRRDMFDRVGGFDPAIRFYMDETEFDLRLAAHGIPVAVVPLAEVHHGFAASARRTGARRPTTLFEEAASTAILLRRHAPQVDDAQQEKQRRETQRVRLVRHLVQGTAEPHHVPLLLADFDAGWQDGAARTLAPPPVPKRLVSDFAAFPVLDGPMRVFRGRPAAARDVLGEAARHVETGGRASVFLFSRTSLYHHIRFTEKGIWEQRGGQFGRSDRDMPVFRAHRFDARVEAEIARLKARDLPNSQALFMDAQRD